MPQNENLEFFLGQAQKREEMYNWIGAAESYDRALRFALELGDALKAGEIQERGGYCSYRASFQAETQDQFKTHIQTAAEAYAKAAKLFEKLEGIQGVARSCDCNASALYVTSWLVRSHHRKIQLLDRCLHLRKKAIEGYDKSRDIGRYGKACNELLECMIDRLILTLDWREQSLIALEAKRYAENGIKALSQIADEYELARAYCLTSYCLHLAVSVCEREEMRKESSEKCLDYAKRALELSQKIQDPYLISLSNQVAAAGYLDLTGNYDLALKCLELMSSNTKEMRDNYLIGISLFMTLSACWNSMMVEEDSNKKRQGYNKAIRYAQKAVSCFRLVSSDFFIGWAYAWCTETYVSLSREVETDSEEKRRLMRKAVLAGRRGLRHARRSGPSTIWFPLHTLSKALYFLSNLETETTNKRQLLEEALSYREEYVKVIEQQLPFDYWNNGVSYNYLALIEAELAKAEVNKDKKRSLVEKAVLNMEYCLELCEKALGEYPAVGMFVALGTYRDWFGRMLCEMYSATGEEKTLRRALEAYRGAVKAYGKTPLHGRVADTYWQIAKVYNRLNEHMDSAENFRRASDSYKTSARALPQLEDFYLDYAGYMQAWSEIEEARNCHGKEEYDQAKQHYKKAAKILQSLKLWSYLEPNFSAWAFLEGAEDLSRREKSKEAIKDFKRAADSFSRARKCLGAAVSKAENPDERDMAIDLSTASDLRQEYCGGRICVEKAKICYKKNELEEAVEKYGLASEAFEKIMRKLESEPEQRELRPITYLCQAWQMMASAESKASPELYRQASHLFEETRRHSLREEACLLALGNSSFCKAMGAGSKFEATRDIRHYASAKQQLESAASCYIKAGFDEAATWVNATEALLDAYVYMGRAEGEIKHEKKMQLYTLVEKHLERALSLFEKTGYIGKRDEVLRILRKVREKSEFALSVADVLKRPLVTSSTALFSTPAPTHEEAVGLNGFEQANIQARLNVQGEMTAGDELEAQVDLVNVAKKPGLLIRICNIIPNGFEATRVMPEYSLEKGCLDMKGKRLDPLEVESLKVSMRAVEAGFSDFSPEIVYVNEEGKFRTCRPEPVRLKVNPVQTFEFKTEDARSIFEYLIGAFSDDYMKRRLFVERSGWRSLVEIIKGARVSWSSLYGAGGRLGHGISELCGRGLVETRVFPGERGRGGRVLKARIAYEKDIIQWFVKQRVMKIHKK